MKVSMLSLRRIQIVRYLHHDFQTDLASVVQPEYRRIWAVSKIACRYCIFPRYRKRPIVQAGYSDHSELLPGTRAGDTYQSSLLFMSPNWLSRNQMRSVKSRYRRF